MLVNGTIKPVNGVSVDNITPFQQLSVTEVVCASRCNWCKPFILRTRGDSSHQRTKPYPRPTNNNQQAQNTTNYSNVLLTFSAALLCHCHSSISRYTAPANPLLQSPTLHALQVWQLTRLLAAADAAASHADCDVIREGRDVIGGIVHLPSKRWARCYNRQNDWIVNRRRRQR